MKSFLRILYIKWNNFFLKSKSPKMISNYIDYNGISLKKTSVSNSTFIDYPQNLKLGERVYIGHFNFLEASHGLTIEEGCQITSFVTITTHSSHQSIRLYGKNYAGSNMIGYVTGSIFIGKYTFIGPHSTIMPNTKIGKGCIVSAYSLVKGSFPDFSIISGNPAKIIGDTREKDKDLLNLHPELKEYYNEWSKL